MGPLSGHQPGDWAYGVRRRCPGCAGESLEHSVLGLAVLNARTLVQRSRLAWVLECGAPALRGVWWCTSCDGCGLTDAPALY